MIAPTVQDAERLKYSDFVGVRFGFFPTTYALVKKKQKKPQTTQKTQTTKKTHPKPPLPPKKRKNNAKGNRKGSVLLYVYT